MLNRADSYTVRGGDTTQMMQLAKAMEGLGSKVSFVTLNDLPRTWDFDVVHIFNRLTLQEMQDLLYSDLRTVPVVLTSNFWFDAGHWFFDAVRKQKKWLVADAVLGRSIAQRLYGKWQAARWKGGSKFLRLKQAMEQCDAIITNSQTEISYLRRLFGLKTKFGVVPVAIDTNRYLDLPEKSVDFQDQFHVSDFVLQVSRLQPNKNQLALINALFDIPVPIVFVGQPSPYHLEYVRYCHERGEQRGNVYFTGYWPDEDLPGVYASAKVHVLPSWAELPGIVSLEAGAAGCQVISTEIGCAKEYLGDLAGYCVPDNLSSIRQAVTSALDSQVPVALRETILLQYTWEKAATRLHAIYEDICHAGSKRR